MGGTKQALLKTVWTQTEALTLASTLRVAGIEVSTVDLNRTGIIAYGQGSAMTGIEVYVPAEQLEAARTHLGADDADHDADPGIGVYDARSGLDHCPHHDAPFDLPCRRCGTFICGVCAQGDALCDPCEAKLALEQLEQPRGARPLLITLVRFALIGLAVLIAIAFATAIARTF